MTSGVASMVRTTLSTSSSTPRWRGSMSNPTLSQLSARSRGAIRSSAASNRLSGRVILGGSAWLGFLGSQLDGGVIAGEPFGAALGRLAEQAHSVEPDALFELGLALLDQPLERAEVEVGEPAAVELR